MTFRWSTAIYDIIYNIVHAPNTLTHYSMYKGPSVSTGWACFHCIDSHREFEVIHMTCTCAAVVVLVCIWKHLVCSTLWHAPKMIHLSQSYPVSFCLLMVYNNNYRLYTSSKCFCDWLHVGGLDIPSIAPLSLLILLLSKEIAKHCHYEEPVGTAVFAPNVLSEDVCQAEDNLSRDVAIEA